MHSVSPKQWEHSTEDLSEPQWVLGKFPVSLPVSTLSFLASRVTITSQLRRALAPKHLKAYVLHLSFQI